MLFLVFFIGTILYIILGYFGLCLTFFDGDIFHDFISFFLITTSVLISTLLNLLSYQIWSPSLSNEWRIIRFIQVNTSIIYFHCIFIASVYILQKIDFFSDNLIIIYSLSLLLTGYAAICPILMFW